MVERDEIEVENVVLNENDVLFYPATSTEMRKRRQNENAFQICTQTRVSPTVNITGSHERYRVTGSMVTRVLSGSVCRETRGVFKEFERQLAGVIFSRGNAPFSNARRFRPLTDACCWARFALSRYTQRSVLVYTCATR